MQGDALRLKKSAMRLELRTPKLVAKERVEKRPAAIGRKFDTLPAPKLPFTDPVSLQS